MAAPGALNPRWWDEADLSWKARISPRHTTLTSLAPQPLHGPVNEGCIAWSEDFDRTFRNERPRVQIPPAPLNALVRAIPGCPFGRRILILES